jgi:hypothetical protein
MFRGLFDLFAELRHAVFVGTVGAMVRWVIRVVRRMVLAFVGTAVLTVTGGIGVVYVSAHKMPVPAGWALIAVVALVLGLLVAGGVAAWSMVRVVLQFARHPFDVTFTPEARSRASTARPSIPSRERIGARLRRDDRN